MYWYEKTDEEQVGYKYYYFDCNPAGLTINILTKYVLTHEEFMEWYEKNKRL